MVGGESCKSINQSIWRPASVVGTLMRKAQMTEQIVQIGREMTSRTRLYLASKRSHRILDIFKEYRKWVQNAADYTNFQISVVKNAA